MSDAVYSSLRGNVSFLGRLLGETIAAAEGQAFLDLVEQIRRLSKSAREGSREAREELQAVLHNLGNEQLVPVARAFSQFLNLANIADQHHNVSRGADPLLSASRSLATGMGELLAEGVAPAAVIAAVLELRIELVLTAHPTEITRRTLIHKHGELSDCLAKRTGGSDRAPRAGPAPAIASNCWPIRPGSPMIFASSVRPRWTKPSGASPWWKTACGRPFPNSCAIWTSACNTTWVCACRWMPRRCQFVSWMGGDRDGNPNVTAKVTAEVMLLRWLAVRLLYLRMSWSWWKNCP